MITSATSNSKLLTIRSRGGCAEEYRRETYTFHHTLAENNSQSGQKLRSRDATPLKNRKRSERDVAIREDTSDVLADYIEMNRPDVADGAGKKPLLASKQGRLSSSTVQRYIYTATRPCVYTGDCPFDEYEPSICEARTWNGSSKCPGSVSPHAVRAGYVTAALNSGQPRDVTGDRTDMGDDVLRRHYDRATRQEKAERRRSHLKNI